MRTLNTVKNWLATLLFLLPSTALAANFSVTPNSGSVQVGSQLAVGVNLTPGASEGAWGYHLELVYNTADLSVNTLSPTATFSTTYPNTQVPGRVLVDQSFAAGACATATKLTSAATVVNISFNTLRAASTSLSIDTVNSYVIDPCGNSFPLTASGGTYTITAPVTDGDGDGTPDSSDCAPSDGTKWRNGSFYPDADGDTVRESTSAQSLCYGTTTPSGYTTNTNGPDNCPTVANSVQTNTDGDAQGDACDTDDDNDGTLDASDCAALDATKWRNQAYPDSDSDGVRNSTTLTTVACFGSTAPTGSTLATNGPDNCATVANSTQTNTDGDAQGDACDTDDDNDGTVDASDCAALDATKWRTATFYVDADADTVRENVTAQSICYGTSAPSGYTSNVNGPDNCPSVSNTTQTNTDGDSQGDACDTDDDNDATSDTSDCAALDATKWRNQAYPDPDSDGVRNSTTLTSVACFGATAPTGSTLATNGPDNCPSVANPTQTDVDGDGIGDACDSSLDTDGDGTVDSADCAPSDNTKWRNQAYPDADNDGVRNTTALTTVACFGTTAPTGSTLTTAGPDNCPSVSNTTQTNTDGDAQGDACDTDDDNDTVADGGDCAPIDASKWRNQAYADTDNDGVRDSTTLSSVACFGTTAPIGSTLVANGPDNCPNVANPNQEDADSDGLGDACDKGVEDKSPAALDFDGDGTSDLATYRISSLGVTFDWISSSDGTKGTLTRGNAISLPAVGDYDGGGLADPTVVTPRSSKKGGGRILWTTHALEGRSNKSLEFGRFGDRILTGCNFDSRPDAEYAVISRDQLLTRKFIGTTVTKLTLVGFTPATKVLGCGDITGDGIDEIIVARTSTSPTAAANLLGKLLKLEPKAWSRRVRRVLGAELSAEGIFAYGVNGQATQITGGLRFNDLVIGDADSDGIAEAGFVVPTSTGAPEIRFIQVGRTTATLAMPLPQYKGITASKVANAVGGKSSAITWQRADSSRIERMLLPHGETEGIGDEARTGYQLLRGKYVYQGQ